MNPAIASFVATFEERFNEYLRDPVSVGSKKPPFPDSKYCRYWEAPPTGDLSDWDIKCWVDLETTSRAGMRDIDGFIRSYPAFSEAGLFSRPTLKVENGLQYMAYTPGGLFAPFLDLHLRGPVDVDLWSAVYDNREDNHQKWSLLTAWRKAKKDDRSGVERTYKDHLERYWPGELDTFISNPQVFYEKKLPYGFMPPELAE